MSIRCLSLFTGAMFSRACAALLSAFVVLALAPVASANPFPRPAEFERDIQFWVRIFTEVDTQHGLIHDNRHLNVVYGEMPLPEGLSRKERSRRVKAAKRRYRNILLTLASGKRKGLSAEERRVLAVWPRGVSNATLRAAADRIRFQLGQSDKVRAGLVRSGRWTAHIEQTLAKMGVPRELIALPLIESTYNPASYSHVGAAGLWQFMRSTGRRYLQIDSVVDERMDPEKATVAAARLLKRNYEITGTWPLAITAYNHGAAGMSRAVRKLGTRNIATIARKYKSRSFGFASRNFYIEFLAAVEVFNNPRKYFGELPSDLPADDDIVEVPAYVTVDTLERALGVDRQTLKRANPALRPVVWNGSRYVPRGFELRVPHNPTRGNAAKMLASISPAERFSAQKRATFYKVRRGDTLSKIAARHRVSIRQLAALNNLRSRHRIKLGQKLKLPASGGTRQAKQKVAEHYYTVRRGDTLSKIASRFGVNAKDLLASNSITDRHRIYVGQKLRIVAPTRVADAA